MSNTKEIKSKIQKFLDQVPENVREDILNYLKQAQSKSSDKVEMSRNLKKILKEDKELLEKLAK